MSRPRILVVEDENIVALDIKMRLQRLGYDIIATVATGELAVQKALETKPDLMLMDINLRGNIDGIETAQQIKQKLDVPIIFLTAYADEATIERAVGTQPFGYVLKPFEERELNLVIQVALDRHQMEKRLRESEINEREQRALAEALRDVATNLNSTLDLTKIIHNILVNVGRIVPSPRISLILLCEADRKAYVAGANNEDYNFYIADKPNHAYPLDDIPIFAQMVDTQKPRLIIDTQLESDWVERETSANLRSYLGTPIISKGSVIGLINLSSREPNAFQERQISYLTAFAAQTAIAIENGRLHQSRQQYTDELEQHVANRTTELEHERTRLQLILDGVGEAIYFVDEEIIIKYANTMTEKVTGYKLDEIIGKSPRIWRGTTPAHVINELDTALWANQPWHGEVINRRKDGMLYPAVLTMRPLQDSEGNNTGYIFLQRDLTDVRQLEHLKDKFVSRIGHELRTPLSNIKLYLDLLERGSPEKQARYMETLQHETARLRTLISGFLEISHLNTNVGLLDIGHVDLNAVATRFFEQNQRAFAQRDLLFEIDLCPDLPRVVTDQLLLHRAITPIIENALNYTPRNGQVRFTTSKQIYDNQLWCTFSVYNSGSGIPAEEQAYLFERFYRGEAARDFKTPGAGLGLSICKDIMDRLNGRILAHSEPEKGVTFTVWLPAIET